MDIHTDKSIIACRGWSKRVGMLTILPEKTQPHATHRLSHSAIPGTTVVSGRIGRRAAGCRGLPPKRPFDIYRYGWSGQGHRRRSSLLYCRPGRLETLLPSRYADAV
ncbi:hypothetical protein DESC_780363 [Desulfosarcina cetonica]|nr:hypothetical protein DESC_780363 [Desulfosarcina cetonica]